MDLDQIDKSLRLLLLLRSTIKITAVEYNNRYEIRDGHGHLLASAENAEDAQDLSERIGKALKPIFDEEVEEFGRLLREQIEAV